MADETLLKLLFETPSGFAILGIDGGFLFEEKPLEIIWTKFANKTTVDLVACQCEFQKFENKSDAINPSSGIDGRLATMIKKWWFGEKLLVGKLEHKYIIEKELNIVCRYDELVLEVMWGMKNLLHIVVPEEELELSDEDSKHRSKGLQIFLQNLNFDIKPDLVNGQITEAACYVYHCLEHNKEILRCMRVTGVLEKEGIDTQGWDALKYVTGFMLMCTNEDPSEPNQGFSAEDLAKIIGAKGKYDKGLLKDNFMLIYRKAVDVHQTKVVKLQELDALVKEAKESAREAPQLQDVVVSVTEKSKIEP
ncbi:hypothetical protein ACQJBY_065283 [Aegilops geniculata]